MEVVVVIIDFVIAAVVLVGGLHSSDLFFEKLCWPLTTDERRAYAVRAGARINPLLNLFRRE